MLISRRMITHTETDEHKSEQKKITIHVNWKLSKSAKGLEKKFVIKNIF
jgi:hypothetical protein